MVKQSSTERMAVNELIGQGYYVIRAAGSFGLFDMIAFKPGSPLRRIQVKKTQGPRSEERRMLKEAPPFCCPGCGEVASTKEIWLYKTKKGVKSTPAIELI